MARSGKAGKRAAATDATDVAVAGDDATTRLVRKLDKAQQDEARRQRQLAKAQASPGKKRVKKRRRQAAAAAAAFVWPSPYSACAAGSPR